MPLTPGRFVGQTLDLRATSSQRAMPSTTVAGIGGVGFSPLHLPGLALWLDAADTSTITSSGSPAKVSQWNDKSGYGRNVSQATGSLQPTTGATTQNGLNVLDFDGGDVLTRATVTITQPYTAMLVKRWTSSGQIAAGQTNVALSLVDGNAYAAYIGDAKWRVFNGTVLSSSGNADNNAHVFASIHSGSRSESALRVDRSVLVGPGNSGTTNGSRVNVGSYASSGGLGIIGWIAEVVVCDRLLTAGEMSAIETYLRTKWAI